jgi:ATP-dependent exoDNAse (exonuclease V) beta subunit
MTRARRRLYLTYADDYREPAGPSAFLDLAAPSGDRRELTRSAEHLDAGGFLTLSEAETLLARVSGQVDDGAADLLRKLGVDVEFVLDPASGTQFWPFEQKPSVVSPGSFSPTSLTDYLRCPRIYWYRHHPRLAPEPVGPEAHRGRFLHQVLEDFHKREAEWRQLPGEAQRAWLETAVRSHLEIYLTRMEAVLDRRREEHEVRRILENYMRFATSLQRVPRRGTLATEKRFRLDLDGDEIHGVIDRINDTGHGTCEVVDYKTGRGFSAPRAYDTYFGPDMYDVQMTLYFLACSSGLDQDGNPLGLEPRFLSLWYPKDLVRGQIRQVLFTLGEPAGLSQWSEKPLSQEDLERGRAVVARAIRGIKQGDFAPRPRDVTGTCVNFTGCAHALICPFARSTPE